MKTISMAKLAGQPDSATSQFFFNLIDNSNPLDSDGGGHTVFGNVIQNWEIVTLLGLELTYNATNFYNGLALADLPFYFDTIPSDGIVKPSDFLQIKKVTIVQE